MRILGIDPGTTSIGYAVIETVPTPLLLTSGLVSITSAGDAERLQELHLELKKLIKKWKPRAAAIEKLFFSKNVKTGMAVSQARGVAMLTTGLADLAVYEYTPLEIKKVITGDGKADKTQVQKMVQATLKETKTLKARDDVFDAIALALTCFYKERRTMRYSQIKT